MAQYSLGWSNQPQNHLNEKCSQCLDANPETQGTTDLISVLFQKWGTWLAAITVCSLLYLPGISEEATGREQSSVSAVLAHSYVWAWIQQGRGGRKFGSWNNRWKEGTLMMQLPGVGDSKCTLAKTRATRGGVVKTQVTSQVITDTILPLNSISFPTV